MSKEDKVLLEKLMHESQEHLKLTSTRQSKRVVDKALGKESFSDKLKRQMNEKRLSK